MHVQMFVTDVQDNVFPSEGGRHNIMTYKHQIDHSSQTTQSKICTKNCHFSKMQGTFIVSFVGYPQIQTIRNDILHETF